MAMIVYSYAEASLHKCNSAYSAMLCWACCCVATEFSLYLREVMLLHGYGYATVC